MFMSRCCANAKPIRAFWGCALLFLLNAALPAADLDPKAVVLYLPLEDAKQVVDLSANPTTGTVLGTLTTADGKFGTKGLQFNGVNANRLQVAHAAKLSGMPALTIEAWVLPRNVASHEGMAIVSKRNAYNDSDLYNLFVYTNKLVNGRINGNSTNVALSKTALTDNTWYHLAFVFDGKASGAEKIKMYVNGVLESSATHPATAVNQGTAPLWVGELDAARGFAWDGVLDEIGIWNVALTQAQVAQVMTEGKAKLFQRGLATDPVPAAGATDVLVDTDPAWTPGEFAATHNVYFGPAAPDVEAGAPATRKAKDLARDVSSVDVGRLDFGRTYYWRVDEVNAAPDSAVIKGDVWSFTTEPFAYPLTAGITATASSFEKATTPAANTVNGSGMTGDVHGVDTATMWNTSMAASGPAWIQCQFDRAYKLSELWVWNYNGEFEPVLGYGFKDVTIEYSLDGQTWTLLKEAQFARATAAAGYAHNTTVDLGGVVAQYIKLTAKSNWSAVGIQQYGLSEVRFFHVPVQARAPQPANAAVGAALDSALVWRPGREAGSHRVFLGTDQAAVAGGAATAQTVADPRFTPTGLDFGTTYYWRVDEVNTISYPGDVWSFSTLEYAAVDDFESYTDDEGNRIYETWIDGWTNSTGAVVGNLQAPFAERTVVRSGRQAMPFEYNNVSTPFYSEAERDFAPMQDWTGHGADTLSLWVRGNPAAYVEEAGVVTISAAGHDIWDTADDFRFAYKSLTGNGSIVVKVESLVNTNAWAKAGVMVRQSLDANSKMAYVIVSYSSGASFGWRQQTGATCGSATQTGIAAPQWVKLTRTGDAFTAQYSADGKTWLDIQSAGAATTTTVAMTGPVYIGLCVTSHNSAATTTAVLSGAATTGNVTGSWQVLAVGDDPQPANSPADLYMVVQDSAGKTATATHPALVTAAAWTQWKIPLSTFSGVNLSKVKKLTLGVGNRAKPVQGGAGKLHLDDIGFGHPLP